MRTQPVPGTFFSVFSKSEKTEKKVEFHQKFGRGGRLAEHLQKHHFDGAPHAGLGQTPVIRTPDSELTQAKTHATAEEDEAIPNTPHPT